MSRVSDGYDIAAYYWPAYHDEPRWRRFMPEGEGEWETIRNAKPKFAGHAQPRVPQWGYLNEADPRVMEKKIDAAAAHGVNTFIFDWYWYENQPFLEDTLAQGFLKARNRARLRFFLMWANHDATTLWDLKHADENRLVWPGAVDRQTFDTVAERVIERFFTQPSYYKIDGKPVFSVYDLTNLINGLGGLAPTREALEAFRDKVRAAGFPGLHLQAILWGVIPKSLSLVPGDRSQTQDNTVRALGFDSLTNYQWCHYVDARGPYQDWAEKAVAAWEGWTRDFSVPFYPHVSVGWDTNPRFQQRCDLVTGTSPELFGDYVRRALAFVDRHNLHPRLVTVNAWNEWSEGSYLEPDTIHGLRYLEAIRDALRPSR
jgi:hypothetical protein